MKAIYLCFLVIGISLLTACSPGHQMAFKQLKTDHSGPVLSVQGYVLEMDEKKQGLITKWKAVAKEMSQQPGFIACYLSPGIGSSNLWLAHSKWDSLDLLRGAFSNPKVLAVESKMPKTQFEHLFSLGNKGSVVHKDE